VLDVAYRATGGAVDLYHAYEELVARDPDFADREEAAETLAAGVDLERYGRRRVPTTYFPV
jgi:hypothetical protein